MDTDKHRFSEAEVRALRDKLSETPISDHSWEQCKEFWMRPAEIEWLQNQAKKK